jgi:hypothetical protein
MRPIFSRLTRQLDGGLLSILLLLVLAGFPFAVQATDSLYTSPATVTGTPPNVDATNFYNAGTWNIFTTLRFTTAHTLNYTNIGTMNGSVGWEFDWGPSTGPGGRGPSANFVNNSASASVNGTLYLWVSATNIVNKGTLTSSANGEIKLTGTTVDLHRSSVGIMPIVGIGNSGNSGTNFTPDAAIYDLYWGQTNMNLNSAAAWDGTIASSPPLFQVNETCGVTNVFVPLGSFIPAVSGSVETLGVPLMLITTNSDGSLNPPQPVYTNIFRQAVFININDPNITGQVRFLTNSSPTNLFQTVAVRLETISTNTITLLPETNDIYLVDTLASTTNGGFDTSLTLNPYAQCSGATFRPGNYSLSRTEPSEFANGSPGDGLPAFNYLYDPAFTNRFVTARYAAYSALVGNIAATSVGSLTNRPGKVSIYAGNLNLFQTRMRAEVEILIQATNLVSSTNAVMDSQSLSYNLGSTNGFLNITNLAASYVNRLQGTVSAWSGVWSNSEIVVTPNYTANASGPPPFVLTPLTNAVQYNLYVLLVDASQLSSRVPVLVQDLILHSTNILVSDFMTIANSYLLDGRSFTLQGGLDIATPQQNWTYANAPTLCYFTNNGSLFIPNSAHFGDDGPTNYLEFVNNGIISAGDQTINSVDFQINNGTDFAQYGNFSLTTQTGRLTGATVKSGADIQFRANTLQISQSALSAGDALDFTVTNSLSDGGFGAGNTFSCSNGFNLWIKPATGELLGTTIYDTALGQAEVDHVWAGQDFGATVTGYTNNAAVGRLILDALGNGLFAFNGATTSNALYVDDLELRDSATNFNGSQVNALSISPNLVIYYAQAMVNGTSVAEKLNHLNGNRLRWVAAYAGYFSSTNIVYPDGTTNTFNAALAQSPYIDSDGDGIVNASDPTPFFVSSQVNFTLTLTNRPPPSVRLQWTTIPLATNYIYYRTNLLSTNWLPLTTFDNYYYGANVAVTNPAHTNFFPSPQPYPSSATNVWVFDAVTNMPHYYRVMVQPWLTYPF